MSLRNILLLVNGIAVVVFVALAVFGSRDRKPAPPANMPLPPSS